MLEGRAETRTQYNIKMRIIEELNDSSASRSRRLPFKRMYTPLHTAARSNHITNIDDIVKQDALAPTVKDAKGRTPLFLAAQHSRTIAVAALTYLDNTVVDIPDNNGWTPMHAATCSGSVFAIRALFDAGSKAIDSVLAKNTTLLHIAAMNEHGETVKELMRLGCHDIDVLDDDGCTPLYVAAYHGKVGAIKMLVRLGAKIDTVTLFGGTPLNVACSNSHYATIVLLRILSDPSPMDHDDCAIPEDMCYEQRYSVYFRHSLSERLLFTNDRICNLRHNSKRKIFS